jgi:hypothetical protein
MPTSGVTAWSMTARDIITAALDENAILPLGEEMEAAEATKCMIRLNALLKSWRIGGHLEATGTVTVLADTASGELDGDIQAVLTARLVESATNERPLARFERDEYFMLPNKTASGTPSIFYADQQRDAPVLYVWPVPTANATLKITYLRKPDTVTGLSETVDIPEEYQEALYSNLAVRCCGIFGIEPKAELVARAQRLEREMFDNSRPASYFMGPL